MVMNGEGRMKGDARQYINLSVEIIPINLLLILMHDFQKLFHVISFSIKRN